MNFLEAVKAMKEGKKLKRIAQIDEFYLTLEGDKFVYHNERDSSKLDRGDVEATDWQIVEEKKTLSDKYQEHTNACYTDCCFCNGVTYDETDVKEAIKDIKEDIDKDERLLGITDKLRTHILPRIIVIINKRIGKRLI